MVSQICAIDVKKKVEMVRRDRDFRSWMCIEEPEHGKLCRDSFPTACGGTQQNIVVRVVQRVEGLCLNGIEVGEPALIERLVTWIMQSRKG